MTDIDKRIDEIMLDIEALKHSCVFDVLNTDICDREVLVEAALDGCKAFELAKSAQEIIRELQAQVVERDSLIKTLGTGIEIVLFTPDLPLMKCEIEGLRKAEAKYKEWKTK